MVHIIISRAYAVMSLVPSVQLHIFWKLLDGSP